MRRALAVSIATLALLTVSPLAGQDDDVARLRAAVRADPEDHSARCRLAYALVRAEQPEPAREAATPAIRALRGATTRRARRLLGACLYNRGRAHEAAGERAYAARDYAESLEVRPNEIVRERLAALVPSTPADAPLAALAILESGLSGADPNVEVTAARTRGGAAVSLVSVSPSGFANGAAYAYAAARVCDGPRVVRIDEVRYDNATHLAVADVTARRLGDLDALVVELEGGGDDNCGTMDGMAEYAHRATAVVFVDGCRLRVARFLTDHHDCEGDDGITVRFDRSGNVIRSRPRGDTPREREGTFSLRDLARPSPR